MNELELQRVAHLAYNHAVKLQEQKQPRKHNIRCTLFATASITVGALILAGVVYASLAGLLTV